jgi:hypothetical protein
MSWWQSTVVLVLVTMIVLLVLLSPTRHDFGSRPPHPAPFCTRHGCHSTRTAQSSSPATRTAECIHSSTQDKTKGYRYRPHHASAQSCVQTFNRGRTNLSNQREEVSIVWTAFFPVVHYQTRVADEKVPLEGRIGRVFLKDTVRSPSKRHGQGTMNGFVSLPPWP